MYSFGWKFNLKCLMSESKWAVWNVQQWPVQITEPVYWLCKCRMMYDGVQCLSALSGRGKRRRSSGDAEANDRQAKRAKVGDTEVSVSYNVLYECVCYSISLHKFYTMTYSLLCYTSLFRCVVMREFTGRWILSGFTYISDIRPSSVLWLPNWTR